MRCRSASRASRSTSSTTTRAIERAGPVVEAATGRYDAVVAPADAELTGIDAARVVLVGEDGTAYMRE